jgi:hypothetical protein
VQSSSHSFIGTPNRWTSGTSTSARGRRD